MPAQLLALPAPPRRLALPAPLKAPLDALLGAITNAIKGEQDNGTRFFFLPDDRGPLITAGDLGYHSMIIGTTRPGKSLLPSFVAATISSEKGRTKMVTIGGDDALLAELDVLSPVDWTITWQSWFPTAAADAVPRIEVVEQSESGMLLAVDVALTCREVAVRLQERFPQLTVDVRTES